MRREEEGKEDNRGDRRGGVSRRSKKTYGDRRGGGQEDDRGDRRGGG